MFKVNILDFKSSGRQADLSVVGSIPTHSRHININTFGHLFRLYNLLRCIFFKKIFLVKIGC